MILIDKVILQIIPVQIYRSTLKVTYLPPSLDVRLRRKGASVGVAINGQVWVVIPQSLRLSGGLHQSHIEFCGRDEEKVKALGYVGARSVRACTYVGMYINKTI